MPVHLRFIAAANSGENGAGSWRDSSISPGSGLEALHSYAGTVVDGVVRSEFSIVLLYEQKIWNASNPLPGEIEESLQLPAPFSPELAAAMNRK